MLLELTRTLIERAQQEETHPIPVVFNLSSWAEKQPPLADWLVEELNARYDVPRKVGQVWIDHDQVLPLLDGLDEVRPDARDSCVEAINAYRQEHGMVGMVVCSRVADYAALTTKLKLRGAIVLQPLTDVQIDSYLAQAGNQLSAVRTLLHEDAEMRELAKTPLMLSIMMLAYQGISLNDLPEYDSPDAQRDHLFDTYVERMLKRRGGSDPYPPEKTKCWLSWLAGRMVEHGQTVFYLERMQPEWLTKRRWLYRLMTGLVVGLGGGLVVGLLGGLVAGPVYGLSGLVIGGSVSGVIYGLADIKPAERIRWSWRHAFAHKWWQLPLLVVGFGLADWFHAAVGKGWSGGLIVVFGTMLIGGLVGGPSVGLGITLVGVLVAGVGVGLFDGLVGDASGGVLAGLTGGLYLIAMNGIVADEITNKTQPNEGIRRSLQNANLVGLLSGLSIGLLSGVVGGIVGGLGSGVVGGIVGGLGSALVGGLMGGSDAVIQHYVLRLVLWRSNHAPLHYVPFLDHAAERILLRKVGGGYIFVHRMLLEYFAGLEEEQR
jgi:hypothetical protein